VEQIVRGAEAPNGTAELLVDAAFRAARDAGIVYFTLGLAPLSRVLEGNRPARENPLWLDFVFGWLRAHGRRFYDFQGLEHFKAKFRPDGWEPIYAICKGDFSPRILLAIAAAFAGGSPFRFLGRALAQAVRQEIAWLNRGLGAGFDRFRT
jgi:phosphatidylglycerol lysyltransferase